VTPLRDDSRPVQTAQRRCPAPKRVILKSVRDNNGIVELERREDRHPEFALVAR